MENKNLKSGVYLIKTNDKDYSLTKEREEKIDNLECEEKYKDFFKKVFSEPIPKTDDLLVELVGKNPFLKIKSIKNSVTGEDITDRFEEIDDVNYLITLTNHFEWVRQNV